MAMGSINLLIFMRFESLERASYLPARDAVSEPLWAAHIVHTSGGLAR